MKIIFSFCRRSSMKIFRQKTAKNHVILGVFLALFLATNFDFWSQGGPKNDFHSKPLLKTCSETSKYPWNRFSRLLHTYLSLQMTKFEILTSQRAHFCKSPTFRHFLGRFYCKSSTGGGSFKRDFLYYTVGGGEST